MLRLSIILTIANYAVASKLDVIYEWKYIDYVWENEGQKNNAIAKGKYNHTQIFTIDAQKVPDGRVFVTTPAFNPTGVPATLSTVSSRRGLGGPLLRPYPSWSWHNQSNCQGITSVWRVVLDECSRLWVLDSGKVGENQVCPAQLLMFDVRSDRLKRRVEIPNFLSHSPRNRTLGLLITPVVETEGSNCQRTWVYMADVDGGGLVIWDSSWAWRLNKNVFNADPAASDFSIAGTNFTLPDGIFGLALTPWSPSRHRRLFFRPLASLKQYYFSTEDLHVWKNRPDDIRYTTYKYNFSSQVTAETFSQEGILFYGLTTEMAIACWNINDPMDKEHVEVVAQDNETLQFASSVKVTRHTINPWREQLWISTNRFQKLYTDTLDFGEINFRILSAPVDVLIRGSKCKRRRF